MSLKGMAIASRVEAIASRNKKILVASILGL